MNYFMSIVIVPLGYADRVIRAANEAGATGATLLRARGLDNTPRDGLFGFKVEPEEDMVMITATKEVTSAVCDRINDEFGKQCSRGGSIYVLPVQYDGNAM
jgi:hypothetical protein